MDLSLLDLTGGSLSHKIGKYGRRKEKAIVPQFWKSNTNSVRGRALEEKMQSLLRKGAVELVSSGLRFYSPMFVVPKTMSEFCPVIDLVILNQSIHKTKFCMETSTLVMLAVRRGDWMLSVDL